MADYTKDFLQLRFVPTMRCNFRCPYCFLRHSDGKETTIFDTISVQEWIEGVKNFSDRDLDIYLWGGEPFCIHDTFEFVRGLLQLDCVKSMRIDTNLSFSSRIIEECASSKLRINGSWHTKYYTLQAIKQRALALKERDMLCMLNFVASEENLAYLQENNLSLDGIVREFEDSGIFMNVAADFHHPDAPEYKAMVTRYTTVEDWKHIHGEYPPSGVRCHAGESFIFVNDNGNLTSCGRMQHTEDTTHRCNEIIGNLFEGTLEPKITACPQTRCPSIISYAYRTDNDFSYKDHLADYARRNIEHRKQVAAQTVDD